MMRILITLFILSLLTPIHSYAASGGWSKVAGEIEETLEEATGDYKDGQVDQAMEKVADAYFGIFEGETANMEIAVRRHISLKKATDLEKRFGDLRKGMFKRLPLSDVEKQTSDLINAVKRTAKELEIKGVGLDVGYR